jgi:metal-responsive CopG/Arc/MetJ family transcriptional regulator
MNEKPDRPEQNTVCVNIPKALYDRVETFCASKNMTADEFIFDAISEMLASVYKEKRRKQRL